MTEPIGRAEYEARIADLLIGRLSGLPRRSRDRHIFLKSVVLTLDSRALYSEPGLDGRLIDWLAGVGRRVRMDHVNLRRLLIETGYLGRSRDGSRYWIAALAPHQDMFEPEVDEVDIHQVLRDSRKRAELRKLQYVQGCAEGGGG